MICNNCSRQISDDSSYCKHCGSQQSAGNFNTPGNQSIFPSGGFTVKGTDKNTNADTGFLIIIACSFLGIISSFIFNMVMTRIGSNYSYKTTVPIYQTINMLIYVVSFSAMVYYTKKNDYKIIIAIIGVLIILYDVYNIFQTLLR